MPITVIATRESLPGIDNAETVKVIIKVIVNTPQEFSKTSNRGASPKETVVGKIRLGLGPKVLKIIKDKTKIKMLDKDPHKDSQGLCH